MKRTKSIYSVTFNKDSVLWDKSRKYNVAYLRCQQNYANELLRSRYKVMPGDNNTTVIRGWLFLNEVLQMLGLPLTEAGFTVGWLFDENTPIGDNFVDFDINPRGTNSNVVLDFNVDGNIGGKIIL